MSGRKFTFRRGALRLAAVAVGFAAVAAVASTPPVISQKGKIFSPGEVRIKPGTTLVVENDDRVMHHVYVESPNLKFDSGEQEPGNNVSITFARPGEYEVMCAIHPKMKLKVHVE